MPVKPTRGRGTHVDVTTSPPRSLDADASQPGPSGRRDSDWATPVDNSAQQTGIFASPEVIAPVQLPAVVIRAATVDHRSPASEPSLDHYVTEAPVKFSQANNEGLRVIKQRTYAELSDGRVVLVALDPDTGFYRARLPSELLPSGPALARDSKSGFWNLHELSGSTTRAQIRQYLPDASDQHADDFISRFGDSQVAEAELKRIELGYPQLDREVGAWEALHNDESDKNQRLATGARLRHLYKWQGDPSEKIYRDGQFLGFELKLHLGSRQAQLPGEFLASTRLDSVVSLHLEGQVETIGNLLLSFPRVEKLAFHMRRAAHLPVGLETLAHLRVLQIQGTHLSAEDAGVLGRLTRLQELDISFCTLAIAPSVRAMADLETLRIASSELTALPAGLAEADGPTRLRVLSLEQNRRLRVAPSVAGMSELQVLNLSLTGITQLPAGLGTENGPSRMQILMLSNNSLREAPSLEAMPDLHVVFLQNNQISRFPEGVTSRIPRFHLGLESNRIESIPETLELREAFHLSRNPINDPASLRRLLAARRQTGTDIWLGDNETNLGINHWLNNIPQEQQQPRNVLWTTLATDQANASLMAKIQNLVRTPEFRVERHILQRRVWSFLEHLRAASPDEQSTLREIAASESSPGKMLDRLEEETRKFDPAWQNDPRHDPPKRRRLE
ncbi:leucine-rich repeat domain-containing protein [Pseudomonas moraviensis subsp. stanleyae]|uniref:leucine-rich repeat domain-containing protein n=1 Tax=Pseudomonas moraviensis TaxID=321662 RepID=UPI002E33BB27|nr:leucine-rich repeat domain-containing protein [Pseudomonas moraviensis]MED7665904.1 leucine-rich repeat domain-containing protein [Pseudomonas moraviensis subsp. stanleyae]